MSVDHTRSWIPSYQGVKKAVWDGEIGGLTRIVAHMGGRRSMLFRNGTHLIDGVCFFANASPVWVIAAHEQGFEDYGPVYDGKGGKDPQYDPGSTIIIEFANGVRGIVNSAKLTPQLLICKARTVGIGLPTSTARPGRRRRRRARQFRCRRHLGGAISILLGPT